MLALESTIEVCPLELFPNLVRFVISFDKVIIVASEIKTRGEISFTMVHFGNKYKAF